MLNATLPLMIVSGMLASMITGMANLTSHGQVMRGLGFPLIGDGGIARLPINVTDVTKQDWKPPVLDDKHWMMQHKSTRCKVDYHHHRKEDSFTIKVRVAREHFQQAANSFTKRLDANCPGARKSELEIDKIFKVTFWSGATLRLRGKMAANTKACVEKSMADVGAGPFAKCDGNSKRSKRAEPLELEPSNTTSTPPTLRARIQKRLELPPIDWKLDFHVWRLKGNEHPKHSVPFGIWCKVDFKHRHGHDHVTLHLENVGNELKRPMFFPGPDGRRLTREYAERPGNMILQAIDDECRNSSLRLREFVDVGTKRNRYHNAKWLFRGRIEPHHKRCVERMIMRHNQGQEVKCEGDSKRVGDGYGGYDGSPQQYYDDQLAQARAAGMSG
ncbi:hypothetical protein B9Z65_4049 [Elsinoe australis]|uniref:Uncharacterized protein n=1 Tax=Elsinoe australis TaxID=40998 RepID=A0A2P7Z1P2_9PEZI|nr:hypothetical protein B9Z65_4049 [Elsinoe australis]